MHNNYGLPVDLPSATVWASTRRWAWPQALPTQGGQPATGVGGAAHTLAVGQGKGVLRPVWKPSDQAAYNRAKSRPSAARERILCSAARKPSSNPS